MLKSRYFEKPKTIHTARTIMVEEISKVMYHLGSSMDYQEALADNVFGKNTKNNLARTNAALKKLYSLQSDFSPFILFQHFWQITPESDKNMLCFLFALGMDHLLYDTVDIVAGLHAAAPLTSASIADVIDNRYIDKYSPKTIVSASKNLISSYRQAGLLKGSNKNCRSMPDISYSIFTYACLMAYLNDDRGEYILKSRWVQILALQQDTLSALASEATLKGLMEFRSGGGVVSISFNNLFTTVGLHGIEN